MVVHGLDDYIDVKCESSLKSECIFSTLCRPHFFVDGVSFTYQIIRKTSWIFGGQWKEIKREVTTYVERIQSRGTKLTFVMPHYPFNTSSAIRINSGLDYARLYGTAPNFDFYEHHPTSYHVIAVILADIGVDVVTTVSNYHLELASFAKIQNATGILSNDSEFIVIGNIPLYRLSTLDVESGNVKCVDNGVLCKNLGLKLHQLSILSFLLGNTVLSVAKLDRFHKKLRHGLGNSTNNPVLDIMPRICMYVRPSVTNYFMLARTVFHEQIEAKFLEEKVSEYRLENVAADWQPYSFVVEESLMLYSKQIHEAVAQDQIKCKTYPFLYDVLVNYGYTQGLTIEHKGSLTSLSFDLYRPIRQLCYGLILGDSATISERCDENIQNVPSSCFEMKKKPFDFSMLQQDSKEKYRWRAFVKCLGVTFNDTLAKELPCQYLGLCCILNYLWHTPLFNLKEYELNAFIAQAVSQYASDVASLQRILVSVVNVRAVSLANVFMRGVEAVLQVSAATKLPLPSLLPYHYFDGKLFSFYYYLSEQGSQPEELCDKIPERLEMFNFLKMMIKSEQLSLDADSASDAEDNGAIVTPMTTMATLVDSTYGGKDSDEDDDEDDDDKNQTQNVDVDMEMLDTPVSNDDSMTERKMSEGDATSMSPIGPNGGPLLLSNSIVPQYEAISDDEDSFSTFNKQNNTQDSEEKLIDTVNLNHTRKASLNSAPINDDNHPNPESTSKLVLSTILSTTKDPTSDPAPLFPKTEALYDALSSDDEERPAKRNHQNSEKENQGSINIPVSYKQVDPDLPIALEESFRNGLNSVGNSGHIKKKRKTSES